MPSGEQSIEIPFRKLSRKATMNIEVKIRITREWKIRMFFAGILLRLAARILGCGIDITQSTADESEEETHA